MSAVTSGVRLNPSSYLLHTLVSGNFKVFLPAAICSTILCHVLNRTRNYHQYFADLCSLFESISFVLERFTIYSKPKSATYKTEEKLERLLADLLGCFVQTCVKAAQLSRERKRDKLKLAVTLFLSGNDTEFQDLLKRIDDLSKEAGLQSTAETLHLAQSTHGNSITLIERDDKRNAKEKMQKYIIDALNITE